MRRPISPVDPLTRIRRGAAEGWFDVCGIVALAAPNSTEPSSRQRQHPMTSCDLTRCVHRNVQNCAVNVPVGESGCAVGCGDWPFTVTRMELKQSLPLYEPVRVQVRVLLASSH